jgi:hypothetical protein
MLKSHKVVLVGPTYAPVASSCIIEDAGFEVRPPARRGDISCIAENGTGIIVLVDGRFNQSLAVGHAELRVALEKGWVIWGLSSMGAIRAFEMRECGMRGFGRIYQHFLAPGDFTDDEVALLHAPEAPYTAFSEPLVHIRHCLLEMERNKVLSANAARHVIRKMEKRWFAERTLDEFIHLVRNSSGPTAESAATEHAHRFDSFRVKTTDLVTFFQLAPWKSHDYEAFPEAAPYKEGGAD